MASLLSLSSVDACSVFAKNDGNQNYVFSKTRDVTFGTITPEYKATHQEIVTFNIPRATNM